MTAFKPLREIITFKGGGTPSKQIPEYWNGAIPWATVKDFVSTSLDRTQDSITEAGLRNSSANLIIKGHVVIPTRMSLGKAAINTIDIAINQDLRALIPKIPLDAHYLLHAVLSLKDEIVQKGSGATVKGITQEALYNLKVFVPPLDDQKRIAHLLGKVEGLIARRKQHLQQLDDLLKSVFLEMFGDSVRNEKGWEKRVFRNVTLKFSDGPFGSNLKSSHYQSEGIRVVRLNNIGVWEFSDSDKAYVSQRHYEDVLIKHTCVPGDVLIGTMGDPNIRACLLPESIPVAINKADCVLCRANPKYLSSYYILGLLNNPCALSLVSNLLHGQTRTRVSMGQLAKLEIPIPPIELQNEFATIVKKVEFLKSHYQQSLADLESLYGALSQKAFKGELDLSKVPLPAEVPGKAEEEASQPEAAALDNSDMIRRFFMFDTPGMSVKDTRRCLLQQWFDEWVSGATANEELSPESFWERARFSALDHLGEDNETDGFSEEDYDIFKEKLFTAIEGGLITQTRNTVEVGGKSDLGNRIILKRAD